MKFTLALGLFLVGMANTQAIVPKQVQIDTFLRNTQDLNEGVQLVSFQQNGQFYSLTYKDGPLNIKYNVKAHKDHLKVVGIEEMITFSNAFSSGPQSINQQSDNQNIRLPPLPLMMPQFQIGNGNEIKMTNVFDNLQEQLAETEAKMKELDRLNFEFGKQTAKRNFQMSKRLKNKFSHNKNTQMPLIGGGDHDFTWMQNLEKDQPLIGAGDHDFMWKNVEVQPLVGGGNHDNWVQISLFADQTNHPIIGGDDHDNWQGIKYENQLGLIGQGDHDNWKKSKKNYHKKKQNRHHSSLAWMNREFSNQEVLPFLTSKLPDMMEGAQIISVENKGFQKRKGFNLIIELKDKQSNGYILTAFFKPRKQQFLIDRIEKVKSSDEQLQTGQQLLGRFIKTLQENTMIPSVKLQHQIKVDSERKDSQVPAQFINEPKMNILLGAKQDPDNDPSFMKMPIQLEQQQNNHIPVKIQETYQVPLLGGQNDPDHKVYAPKLHDEFNVEGLPLPGSETDPDNSISFEKIIDTVLDMAKNLQADEDIEDIDQKQQVPVEEDKKTKVLVK